MTYHVVCTVCGCRWTTDSLHQVRQCRNKECEAGWMDLPMFASKTDADNTADQLAHVQEIAVAREP